MKAIILAGGEGKRLRPITAKMPKPLVPINGIPAIELIIGQLADAGITEAAVTTGYLAEMLENSLGGECRGVKLTYFREKTPLGTAGGIIPARDFIAGDDFIVASGDSVSDISFSDASDRFFDMGRSPMIILSHADEPGEYGVVLTDGGGRVTGFSEKPSISSTCSDTVNTGNYIFPAEIFDSIPEGVGYDFGRDLFPALINEGKPVVSFCTDSYWCDIGDCASYYGANMRQTGGENSAEPGCIAEGADVKSSVVMKGCTVAPGARIDGAVLCPGVKVGDGADIGKGCVIGDSSVIGAGAVVAAGTRLEPDTVISAGSYVGGGGFSGAATLLGGGGIRFPREKLTLGLASRIGSALASVFPGGRVGVMHDGSADAFGITSAILRGLRRGGCGSILCGQGFAAEASLAAAAMKLSLSLFVCRAGEDIGISFFDGNGLYPKRETERAFVAAMSAEPSANGLPGKSSVCGVGTDYYLPMLTSGGVSLYGLHCTVRGGGMAAAMLKRALTSLGAMPGDGLALTISEDGFSLTAEQNGFVCDDWHIKALLLRYTVRGEAALPVSSPAALSDIGGGRVKRYTRCPSGNGEDGIRALAGKNPELIHACAAAVSLCTLLVRSGKTLEKLSEAIPPFWYGSFEYKSPSGRDLSVLPHLGTPAGDGVYADYFRGGVRVVPTECGYRILADAVSGEYADELIGATKREIEKRMKKQ